MKPEDLFRVEKERATGARNSLHAKLLAEAKAAFDKLMAEGQAARKSGRPRKHPLPPLKTGSALRPMAAPPAYVTPAAAAFAVPKLVAKIAKITRVAKPAKSSAKKKIKAKAKHKAKMSARGKAKPKARRSKKR